MKMRKAILTKGKAGTKAGNVRGCCRNSKGELHSMGCWGLHRDHLSWVNWIGHTQSTGNSQGHSHF